MIDVGMQTPHETAIPSKLCATLAPSRRLRMDGHRLSIFPSNKAFFAAAILACAIACTGSVGLAHKWVVVNDPTATGGYAIEQSSADQTDNRFPLAIYSPLSVKNIAAVVRFKSVAGKVDQAAGVVVRLIDPNNYYVVRANALEDNVRFYRVVKGRREQIEGANLKVSANEWHTATASPSRSMANSCSRQAIELSPKPADLRFGPRRTASRASIGLR
jgi:hypothetical protein